MLKKIIDNHKQVPQKLYKVTSSGVVCKTDNKIAKIRSKKYNNYDAILNHIGIR